MSVEPNDQFDYPGAFRALMERSGAASAVIEEYLVRWNVMRGNGSRAPCPICYVAGGWGDVGPPERQGVGYAVSCSNCKVSIPVAERQPRVDTIDARGPAQPLKGSHVRWELVFANGPGPGSWTWRSLGIDGSIEQTSEPHQSFGKAIRDAMDAGFSPKRDVWVIKRQNWITTFHRGSIVSTGPNDQVIGREPRRVARSQVPGDGAGPSAASKTIAGSCGGVTRRSGA